jgi:hypothetical protein
VNCKKARNAEEQAHYWLLVDTLHDLKHEREAHIRRYYSPNQEREQGDVLRICRTSVIMEPLCFVG